MASVHAVKLNRLFPHFADGDFPGMTTINRHQCFMTRAEMLAAVVMHARIMASVLEHHLTADVPLDIGVLEELAYRALQLVQSAKDAGFAEDKLAEAVRLEAMN
jgi:hypothetical protein